MNGVVVAAVSKIFVAQHPDVHRLEATAVRRHAHEQSAPASPATPRRSSHIGGAPVDVTLPELVVVLPGTPP
jgi:hypothetical protein